MLHFQRRFALAGALCTAAEAAAIGFPLKILFTLDEPQRRLLRVVAPTALACAWLVWWLVMRFWRAPLDRAVRLRRAGAVLDSPTLDAAYRASLEVPRRSAWLRALLGAVAALIPAAVLSKVAGFSRGSAATVVAIALAHGLMVQVFRAIAAARILGRVRAGLLPDLDPLRLFRDQYHARLTGAALATGALGVTAVAAFTHFFLPINLEQYLRLESWYPPLLAVLAALWIGIAHRMVRPIDGFLAAATSAAVEQRPPRDDPRAVEVYRLAQSLPYRLALTKLALALVGAALLAALGPMFFAIDLENAVLIFGEATVVAVGVAIYEVLWHRATLRPLLIHIVGRHRPSPEAVRTPLSLRTKMLASFGGLTLFACGLSLFWSFVQYKTLATSFIQRETQLRLSSVVADLHGREARAGHPLANDAIAAALRDAARDAARDKAVLYYLPPDEGARPIALGGDRDGPPPLPWSGERLMRRLEAGQMELTALQLTGVYARLYDERRQDLGSIAVLYPGYRGRGASIDRQILVLLFFFVVLAATSMGIVVLVATDLTAPIRLLERRALAMAKGDLARPVLPAAVEADEVGRLTYSFEEMRRALNEKLRSSTEINLSLEAEVTRRTAELERRNRELAETLEQLKRTQDELVRSEKMASMGRLVAGIAHEINNPVNAVVNTAGPLETTVEELVAAGSALGPDELRDRGADVREMLRVIQRGARRTKEIVQALHNYSRGDDHRVSDVDLHRGIDESLDLLRHHLKHGVTVEKRYGDVGRMRGYPAQLHQVFMNLITNAAQALGAREAGGVIRIETRRDEDRVVVVVADNGPGIPASVLPRIFDPFFTTKDVGEGSGLGLSIVHGIVERHGGTIAVESEIGKGTTFTVTLPADGPARAATATI